MLMLVTYTDKMLLNPITRQVVISHDDHSAIEFMTKKLPFNTKNIKFNHYPTQNTKKKLHNTKLRTFSSTETTINIP